MLIRYQCDNFGSYRISEVDDVLVLYDEFGTVAGVGLCNCGTIIAHCHDSQVYQYMKETTEALFNYGKIDFKDHLFYTVYDYGEEDDDEEG